MLTHIVVRQFNDGGVERLPGEAVNAMSWRWAHKLEEQGRLRPLSSGIDPVKSKDGRFWVDRKTAESHSQQVADVLDEYPVNAGRNKWRLSDGTVVNGSKATATAHQKEILEQED